MADETRPPEGESGNLSSDERLRQARAGSAAGEPGSGGATGETVEAAAHPAIDEDIDDSTPSATSDVDRRLGPLISSVLTNPAESRGMVSSLFANFGNLLGELFGRWSEPVEWLQAGRRVASVRQLRSRASIEVTDGPTWLVEPEGPRKQRSLEMSDESGVRIAWTEAESKTDEVDGKSRIRWSLECDGSRYKLTSPPYKRIINPIFAEWSLVSDDGADAALINESRLEGTQPVPLAILMLASRCRATSIARRQVRGGGGSGGGG
ncbi:MAG: hypothetical protein V3U46_10385 [Acidimicrobiia bacterium]